MFCKQLQINTFLIPTFYIEIYRFCFKFANLFKKIIIKILYFFLKSIFKYFLLANLIFLLIKHIFKQKFCKQKSANTEVWFEANVLILLFNYIFGCWLELNVDEVDKKVGCCCWKQHLIIPLCCAAAAMLLKMMMMLINDAIMMMPYVICDTCECILFVVCFFKCCTLDWNVILLMLLLWVVGVIVVAVGKRRWEILCCLYCQYMLCCCCCCCCC